METVKFPTTSQAAYQQAGTKLLSSQHETQQHYQQTNLLEKSAKPKTKFSADEIFM